MPDPRQLKVGDRVRFVSLPEAWQHPKYRVDSESRELIELLIARRRPCRISRITEDGYPWIDARVRRPDGTIAYHSWGIYESTGWRLVRPSR